MRCIRMEEMKEEYDFTKAKKNPYAKKLRQQVTINLDSSVIDYSNPNNQQDTKHDINQPMQSDG